MDEELETLQTDSQDQATESPSEGADPLEVDLGGGIDAPDLDASVLDAPALDDGIDLIEPDMGGSLEENPLDGNDLLESGFDSQVSSESTGISESGDGILGLGRIQQLKVKVQAMLGATPLSISELANLQKGDVIKLDTKIGDPISILANGEEIARAEIVVMQEDPPKFGLTLTEIIETNDDQKE